MEGPASVRNWFFDKLEEHDPISTEPQFVRRGSDRKQEKLEGKHIVTRAKTKLQKALNKKIYNKTNGDILRHIYSFVDRESPGSKLRPREFKNVKAWYNTRRFQKS